MTSTDLISLDYVVDAQPFTLLSSTDTTTLDTAVDAQPFVAAPDPVVSTYVLGLLLTTCF